MTIEELVQHYSPSIEDEIESLLSSRDGDLAVYDMIRYQLGWSDPEGRPVSEPDRARFGGKRLRGTLCLLAAEAVGGDFRKAIPAAAALELIHNFSLVHDDIEDGDTERRHRPTVWKVWGIPQAINAGSAMQALVTLAGLRVSERGVDPATSLQLANTLNQAVLRMTEGQYLDMSFEKRETISLEEYFRMTSLKTGALIEASLRAGALLGGGENSLQESYADFGMIFGLAFQARDDVLGIWGDPKVTGKPVGSDILAQKKNLPLVYGVERAKGEEQDALRSAISRGDVETVLRILDHLDAKVFTNGVVSAHTNYAEKVLLHTGISNSAQDGIWQIAEYALGRER